MLHFLKITSLETTFQNNLRVNYENFERIEDRKSAVTFYAVNCRTYDIPYSIEKCSRNRFRILSVSKSIEVTCFWPVFCFKLNFTKNLWFFKKKFCRKIIAKEYWTTSKHQISYMFYILELSIFLGIDPKYNRPHGSEVNPSYETIRCW